VHPECFIDWFENQPIDKANAIGFSASQPGCRVIGLRQYALYPNFANLYTTQREVANRIVPPESWVSGSGFVEMLRQYDQSSVFRVVPALRYSTLYAKQDTFCPRSDLVIALTHSGEESLAILEMVLPFLERAIDWFDKVRIKPHSDFPVAKFNARFMNRWPWIVSETRIHFESSSMEDLLRNARIFVTAGTSAALEALCQGVPVIMAGRQAGLDINPLTEINSAIWTVAYDSGECEKAIVNWSPIHPVPMAERVAIGQWIRAEYFEPVSEASMLAFDPRYMGQARERVET
jgi:hypothetical protein